ncbi:alpha/beta hydrolase [Ramlibacter sp. XY19]|uniref:alpha/beta hydrolase n=1 Tax=Ramlibacter paludis TaxID=2908000 RepID=UPI0023DCE1B9|nr:alpha/beta hydrolase [Ramlibacter paludis]MCG2593169.1 alpha/beta hydrolase [Ramlibacter paludis]
MDSHDGGWHDRMYNNRELVPDHGEFLARWAESSSRARAANPCHLDLRYGDQPGETLDVFPAPQPNAPVLVFIHGGYWRALDKADHSFIAPSFTRDGACVVIPNYALAPAVTVPQITLQMVRAVAWTFHNIARFGGDPRRIKVAGHSAGGQLAAMLLTCQWAQHDAALPRDLVREALAISALHDLEPIMRAPFLQQTLALTPQQVAQASPARLPAPRQGTLYSVVGGAESEEYLRQNRLIHEAWGPRRVPVCEALPGRHHFSVLDALVEPSHRLHQLALDLLRV